MITLVRRSTLHASEQGTHHFVMTCQKPQAGGRGMAVATWDGDFTPNPQATRREVFDWLRREFGREFPDLARGNVLFFCLERNTL
ncbi:hypothetical protein [Streptomyces qinglanensis]|uniref:Uncharacterized protein n=1 Tax=Streptomyces qinglanensis TaxID=943816 RepID=A0A1H9Q4T2_9ACTN|nr:hypothetical protein [Streptomyces qinglanensis]SER55438.1 hypothetical protein SAMN05421870_102458 [Streptomyces qinglanensis]